MVFVDTLIRRGTTGTYVWESHRVNTNQVGFSLEKAKNASGTKPNPPFSFAPGIIILTVCISCVAMIAMVISEGWWRKQKYNKLRSDENGTLNVEEREEEGSDYLCPVVGPGASSGVIRRRRGGSFTKCSRRPCHSTI